MLPVKIGLIDGTGKLDHHTMSAAAAALNVQVTRDLPQFWAVKATVAYLPGTDSVPQGVWPVQLVEQLPPGAGGFHLTDRHQPYAKVLVRPDWTIQASHEILEMLVDQNGNKLHSSTAIGVTKDNKVQDQAGQFEYVVEICDPCQADPFSYAIDGVQVSDFITPHFYDAKPTPGTRYSFTGAVKAPRGLLPGGYITWVDPHSSKLQQILWIDPRLPPHFRDMGAAPKDMSLRGFIDSKTHPLVRSKWVEPSAKVKAHRKANRDALAKAAKARAKHYV
jgi:hypothetical protein